MVIEYKTCKHCESKNIVKNGHSPEGVQKYSCKDCGRHSRAEYKQAYTEEQKEKILKAYHEKSSMRGIQRTFGVARQTLSGWLKKKVQRAPDLAATLVPAKRSDILELDELWSYVGSKANKVWLWIALCRRTRQVVGFACGDRGLLTCNALYESLPKEYRRCQSFSDFWDSYDAIFPKNTSVGKESGQTAHIERFNNTLRQRVGRLVRKTLSFSKDFGAHFRSIEDFLISYNLSIT